MGRRRRSGGGPAVDLGLAGLRAERRPRPLSRRRFLALAAGGILVACGEEPGAGDRPGPTIAAAPTTTLPAGVVRAPRLGGDPFTLGVASGDPLADRVVLWTRLAPAPTDGGGMPDVDVAVDWEVATDDRFASVVGAGTAIAPRAYAHSVHVDVGDLVPDRPYWYRFRVGDHESPPGRTRTMPAPGSTPSRFRVAHVSCQHRDWGYYHAYADMVAQGDLDLVLHVGDYIYEGRAGWRDREDPLPEAVTLDQYRNHHGLYKTEPHLQAAHAMAPWLTTWDDHEVDDNYRGAHAAPHSVTPDAADFAARRAAAYQAWWEHMPIRAEPPAGGALRIHRRVDAGGLVRFLALDTRQYRSDQACAGDGPFADIGPRCEAAFGDEVTMLGADQEAWLERSLRASPATWNVLASSVVVHQWRFTPGNLAWNLDQWDGYPAARDRLLGSLAGVTNPIVCSGDVHSAWVGELATDFDDPDAAVLGTEFVGTSVTSPAPIPLQRATSVVADQGPHVHWGDASHRGWTRHEVTPTTWTTTFRAVDDVTEPDSSVRDAATWVIPAGGRVVRA